MGFRFEIDQTDAGYHVRTRAKNGEVLNSSEVLTSHENAVKNIKAVYEGMQCNVAIEVIDFSVALRGFIENGKLRADKKLRKK